MPTVHFTPNLKRHIECPPARVNARNVREALDAVFAENMQLRRYVLDDQGRLRKHMRIAVDGEIIRDRTLLTDTVGPGSEIYVMQALSGG
ncbi:MAG: MoaD/ThiS family protein, partial [Gammaproteobacteria bacterium]